MEWLKDIWKTKSKLQQKNKFNLSIVRPFNIYGDRYKWVGPKSQAIPMLINKVVRSKKK